MAKKSTKVKFDIDVTDQVELGENDVLPITRCVCGRKFDVWHFNIYKENPTACPACGRKFYFTNKITVWEVIV